MASNLVQITSVDQLKHVLKTRPGGVVLNFAANWSELSRQLDTIFEALASKYPNLTFAKIEAEDVPEVSEAYSIESAPTFVILKNCVVQHTLVGANPPELMKLVEAAAGAQIQETESLNARLKALVNDFPVMAFIKGTVEQPRCGFSSKMIALLQETKVPFKTFDILSDNVVREGLKVYSSWPTYPQLYVNGNLIGGIDIAKELLEEGTLVDTLMGN